MNGVSVGDIDPVRGFNAVQGEQRQYLTLVKSFQEACTREEELRGRLKELRRE
jgi:hypothetical protein